MKRLILTAIVTLLCISLAACGTDSQGIPNPFFQGSGGENSTSGESSTGSAEQAAETARYHFESIEDELVINESYQFMDLIAGYPRYYGEQSALIQGKLLTLFGEPLYESADYGYSYDYAIKVTDDENGIWYLSVYQGYYGPAIATYSTGENIPDMAYALYCEIIATSPTDFHYDGYYPDTPSKVRAGVRNGEPYYSEKLMTAPEEIQRMYDILGWEPEEHLDSEAPYKL